MTLQIEMKAHSRGTHRVVSPEDTLRRIAPLLARAGITRCADVTGLDSIGIPGFTAIRPRGVALQVSNGKGLRPVDAKVSALMEGLEVFHAENPIGLRRASLRQLRAEGLDAVSARELPRFDESRYFSDEFVIDWAPAEELISGRRCWVPAGSVYLSWPSPLPFSSNGLASGNTASEATLHALYELIERDAISRVSDGGRLDILGRAEVIDLETVGDEVVRFLHEKIERAGLVLRLIRVPSAIDVHTFWAILVDPSHFAISSVLHGGSGTHLSPSVAASRAITEAAQARLAVIHGSREDFEADVYRWSPAHAKVRAYFLRLKGTSSWSRLVDHSGASLDDDHRSVTRQLVAAGFGRIYRTDLGRRPFDIPVVKVQVPGLRMREDLF